MQIIKTSHGKVVVYTQRKKTSGSSHEWETKKERKSLYKGSYLPYLGRVFQPR